MKTKGELRAWVSARRRDLDPEWVDEHSVLVERNVMDLQDFAEARVVGCYVAMPGEVRVDGIVEQCWQENRVVCVPAFRPEIDGYSLARFDRHAEMSLGPWDILEPASREWMPVEQVDLILVPGLAFGHDGSRLGHGKGYYDRLLRDSQEGGPTKVGMAFEFQVFDQVPMVASDVMMDMVVTESRIIKVT